MPADLRQWDPAAVEGVFTTLGDALRRLDALDDQAATARTSPEAWQGSAADAARATHDAITARLEDLRTGVGAIRLPLADAADGVAALRAELADLDARAAAAGFGLGSDGTVTDMRQTVVAADQVEAYRAERTAAQADLVDAVRRILSRADDLDATLLSAITRATATYAVPPGTFPAGAGSIPDPGPAPTGSRTPVPDLGDTGRGYLPAPMLGPLVTLPAPVGPNVLGTPAAADLGLGRVHSDEGDPPFPPPTEITGRTEHGEQQIQGRDGRGVTDEAVEDAVANPKTPPYFVPGPYGGAYRYVGENATVILNRDGKVVTAWANNRSGARHA